MHLKLVALAVVACAAGIAASLALGASAPPAKKPPLVCSKAANVHLTGTLFETDADELLMMVYESRPDTYEGREVVVTFDKNTKFTREGEKAAVEDLVDEDDLEVDARSCKRQGFSRVRLVATKVVATASVGEADGEDEAED